MLYKDFLTVIQGLGFYFDSEWNNPERSFITFKQKCLFLYGTNKAISHLCTYFFVMNITSSFNQSTVQIFKRFFLCFQVLVLVPCIAQCKST